QRGPPTHRDITRLSVGTRLGGGLRFPSSHFARIASDEVNECRLMAQASLLCYAAIRRLSAKSGPGRSHKQHYANHACTSVSVRLGSRTYGTLAATHCRKCCVHLRR